MKRKLLILAIIALILGLGTYTVSKKRPPIETKFVQPSAQRASMPQEEKGSEPINEKVTVKTPGDNALLENPKHTYRGATSFAYQTFNNCGPATLSMMLSWYGLNVSQKELGDKMRPYQNPEGDNDDKTIFTYEFVKWGKKYGFNAMDRRNGDITLLKTFTANGIPVVVKTWLNVNDDIGHFRIVRGYDEGRKVIIQDDSYHGPNKQIPYFDFLSMWQPFNYDYMIIYKDVQKDLVEAILGEELNEQAAWRNALIRAQKEAELDPENVYPWFNIATAFYHLADFQKSVEAFERVEIRLPRRMLWYQIEPIMAYKELGNFERVFQITDYLFNNGNRAFSELYQLRGEIYLSQGDKEKAREQFELAILYNQNFEVAKRALENL